MIAFILAILFGLSIGLIVISYTIEEDRADRETLTSGLNTLTSKTMTERTMRSQEVRR